MNCGFREKLGSIYCGDNHMQFVFILHQVLLMSSGNEHSS